MSSNIVSPSDFIPSEHMIFTKPKVNSVGGKSIGILNSQTKRSIMLSTPLMLNWGVNVYENQGGGGNSYSLSLQFPREEFSNPEVDSFLEMLKNMEEQVKESAFTNSKEWFGKAQSKEVIEAFWNPILKYPKDPNTNEPDPTRNPTMKVKLPTWDGEYKFELFDVNNEMLIPNSDSKGPEEFIQKGSNIACILQCGGLWFANGNFGVSWRLFQGIVKPTETLVKGKCHITLSGEDRKQIGNDQTEAHKESAAPSNTAEVESDEEEETGTVSPPPEEAEAAAEEEVVEPEPEPEKPKKKKVVKKKA